MKKDPIDRFLEEYSPLFMPIEAGERDFSPKEEAEENEYILNFSSK